MGFLAKCVVSTINHVLSNESWARSRLLPFAGQAALIEAPPLQLAINITPEGLFKAIDIEQAEVSVSIMLPGDSALKIISGDQSVIFAAARISGSADFAEALAFVFRNLHWDAEADLAALVGDIPASRSMRTMESIAAWHKSAALNLAQNLKEFVVEESQQVVAKNHIADFSSAVDVLRDDLARLEKRISRL